MKRNSSQHSRTIEETLNRLYQRNKGLSKGIFWVLVFVYILDVVMISLTAGSTAEVAIAGYSLPVYTFAGVLSSLSNICIILLTVYFDKRGFITALILLLAEFPMILMGIFVRHNITSLPGVFGNILTLFAIIIIYLNNKKISEYQNVLRTQAVTDMLTGLPNWFACTELIKALVERKEPFAVVNIDINGFKIINDTMGFETGNKVLVDISSKWKKIAIERG